MREGFWVGRFSRSLFFFPLRPSISPPTTRLPSDYPSPLLPSMFPIKSVYFIRISDSYALHMTLLLHPRNQAWFSDSHLQVATAWGNLYCDKVFDKEILSVLEQEVPKLLKQTDAMPAFNGKKPSTDALSDYQEFYRWHSATWTMAVRWGTQASRDLHSSLLVKV